MNLYIFLALILMGPLGCNQTKSASPADTAGSNTSDPICSQMATAATQNTSFSLALAGTNTNAAFQQAANQLVNDNLDPHVTATPGSVQTQGQINFIDYPLSIEGVPLCSNRITVYQRPPKGSLSKMQLWMTGKQPSVQGVSQDVLSGIASLVYPTQDYAVSNIYAKLKLQGPISSPTAEPCIIFESGAFTPALNVTFKINRRQYMGTVVAEGYALVGSDTVRSAAPRFLQEAPTTVGTATVATGVATNGSSENVYATKTVQLKGLSAGGSLCSTQFVSLSLSGSTNNPVLSPFPTNSNENFTFPQSNPQFFAATTFYNASSHVAWLKSNGYISDWPGPQVQIVLDMADSNDSENNGVNDEAVYLPNGNSLADPPQIELGNGDGQILRNLWTDPDAVQHETGHHLIYTRLTEIGDSIVVTIHEGYADGQVLLQNGSPCLCPTVCPPGGNICLTSHCLRSAANNFTMAAPDCPGPDGTLVAPQCLPTEVHQRSQVISGMLWDIAQDIGPQNDGYKIALQLEINSITYLTADSEYDAMLEALIKADEDLFDGKYQKYLLQEMCARGFDSAQNPNTNASWMSKISVAYTCATGSSLVPTGGITAAPLTSGAVNIPTTATGGQ